ncbi:calcium-binding protein [Nocardioides humilatus]|uniref:Calcium-binding protein n=1 Tax=Nocardioides humilatus TaxID=2607660 RepID=A0A5B1LEK4_9ACTN|nr:calcium-binding protein [Nocardioides humilatus]KAA1418638.1 calcium-binding protein [Nocardioides humilatus]
MRSSEPKKCGGQVVTVDLNDPDAPDPLRSESDVVLGTVANDSIATGPGDDVVCGGLGGDGINGGLGDDVLIGGPGDDFLSAGAGDDLYLGGPGKDVASFEFAVAPVEVDLRLRGPQDTGWGADTLHEVEGIIGSDNFANRLVGDASDNYLHVFNSEDNDLQGRGGDDSIFAGGDVGRGGANELWGGRGDDNVHAGGGTDRVFGGPGDDVLCGGTGVDVAGGGPGNDVLSSCDWLGHPGDQVYGGAGNDLLRSAEGDEVLVGGDGFDEVRYTSWTGLGATVDLALRGPQDTRAAGIDHLVGIEGLIGTDEGDVLLGDDGPNALAGGRGPDLLDGRGGVDTCDGGGGVNEIVGCEETPESSTPATAR